MFFHKLLLLLLLSLSLFASPTISQLRTAINSNPALLNTPEARAILRKKGISSSDLQERINKNRVLTTHIAESEDIENNIAIIDDINNTIDVNNSIKKDKEEELKRLNPFSYKTNEELRKDLNSKQQLLVSKKLSRYSDSFYANRNIINSASLVTPDNYTISSGDVLDLYIYGDRDKKQSLEVHNDGTVQLDFIGPVKIGGMSYKSAKLHIINQLKQHFKNSSFKIIISKYSSIQVTLIGDVKNPGIYNLSSFSTTKDLMIASKGIRESASVRDIIIKRDGKTIADLDFYNLLFKGENIGSVLLKHGDIIIIKKAKKLVSIDGFVNNSAIFELKHSENLDTLIRYAGGMKANASKRQIKIDRYSDNLLFETFHISYKEAKKFKMRDGDKVYIYKLDDSDDYSVNLYGNIIRPGSYGIHKNMTLTELFRENLHHGLKKFFLPETYLQYGIIKRYANSLNYETKTFNLEKVIAGKEKIKIYPQDEIYIFSINDIKTTSYITTKGDILINAGKLRYFKGMTIKDAVNASGIDGIIDDKIRVTTIDTEDRMPKTVFYSFKSNSNKVLSPYDEVEVYDYYKTHLLEPVTIKGEVINPTTVFYEKGMTLKTLFESSGGLTNMAYRDRLEIVRYYIDNNKNRNKKIINIDMTKMDTSKYFLKPYDEVTIYKIPNWGEKNIVTLKGEVKFPGTYTVGSDEKLSSVIKRAGGYTKDAFIEGAVFTRESIKQKQIDQYNRALSRIKRELALYNAMPANSKRAVASVGTSNTLNEVILEAKKYQPIGRVSVNLDNNLSNFKDSKYDLVLKDKDTITIPNKIDTVTVFGEVFNPTSFVYDGDKGIEDYVKMASGLSRTADENNIYVIHANGTSEPVESGWFSHSIEIKKGDTIVIPVYIKENNTLDIWDSVSKILASFALTAAAVNSLGVF